jgi:hypothetical protein
MRTRAVALLGFLALVVATSGNVPSGAAVTAILVGAGDIAKCSSSGDEATAKLLDGIGGTVFTVGDNAYPNGSPTNFNRCYDPTWGRHKSRTRPAAGNHEYRDPNAAAYFGYFGAAAGAPGKGWYSFDLGAWHIVVLNSNCKAVGGCGPSSPQVTWLRADLAANPSVCTAAIFHHPRWSSGNHGSIQTMNTFWRVLHEHGADVVLNGHDHSYERFAPMDPNGNRDLAHGLREFVVGTGGAELQPFGSPLSNSEKRISGTFGVLKLSLEEGSYEWRFVPVAGQSASDQGAEDCR